MLERKWGKKKHKQLVGSSYSQLLIKILLLDFTFFAVSGKILTLVFSIKIQSFLIDFMGPFSSSFVLYVVIQYRKVLCKFLVMFLYCSVITF